MNNADLVFVNLENPIVEQCLRKTNGMVFCAPPEMLSGLLPNKTIVNLANNHTLNYGNEGLASTVSFLSKANISATGYSQLVTRKIGDTTFGFLGFDKSQLANPTLTETERQFVVESKAKVDILIIALHWGIEYQQHPTEGQRKLAQELVSLGANVIVGHHPHWVQDTEMLGSTPVYYSLGNLIFDQTWSEETRKGLLVKLTFQGKTLEKQELIPTYIKQTGQPIIMPSPNE
jgi:poly-gamma-glutamate synthesis protein (capsule biosynthesis protein)